MFYRAPDAEPEAEGHATHCPRRHIAQIEDHHSKTTAVNQHVSSPKRLLDIATTYPEEPFQLRAGRPCGKRIEGILSIHPRAGFLPRGHGRQNSECQCGAA